MYFSKHNILSKLRNSEEYFLVNILSGNADIISKEKFEEIQNGKFTDIQEYFEKGYLTEEQDEKRNYIEKYLEFTENRENDEVQIFFVPWYLCNFSCSYCYQVGYENEVKIPGKNIVDAFFEYVKNEFAGRRKYITLFGGEPLLPGKQNKEFIKYFLQKCDENNLEIAIVTNGFNLEEYIEILKKVKIREIQVTLDGTAELHDKRRYLKDNSATFEKIVKGIDAALENNLTINLRVVIDKENIEGLYQLSKYAIEKGWTENPLFKTQLGRNYELHYCQKDNDKLFTRLDFYESIFEEIQKHPEILEFHKPAFSISKFLFENGELPKPLFDACTGCKTEWAFDYTGNIYSCTATVGKIDRTLGTFFPEVHKNFEAIEEWEERDVTMINECKECNLQLACGGGCAEVAYNKNGKLHSPDCRPITELMEMGISHFFKE